MKKTLLILVGAISAAGLAIVQGAIINVQFNDDSINLIYDAGAGSPSPLPVMTGAAVIGSAGDVWNQVTAANLTYAAPPLGATTVSPVALTDVNGAPTGVSLTLSAPNGTYNANSVYWGNHSPFTSPTVTPYSALMQTCLVANNGSGPVGNVTLTGLAIGQAYNLYVYTAADQNVGLGRTGTFTVGANSQNYTWDGVTSTLVNGVTYLEFAGVTSVGGTLVIDFGNATAETDFNGLQLVAVPEPGTLALLGVGLSLLFIRRRK